MRHRVVPWTIVGLVLACSPDEPAEGETSATSENSATSAAASGADAASESSGAVGQPCDPSDAHAGEATYYDFADGSGNCSFPATPDDLMVGAMNHADYAGSAVCGTCVHIEGPEGEIDVRIVDQCPECPEGDIDLSPDAFALIAPLEAGRVPITWQYVPCPVSGPVVYHFKDGSNPWWTAVQIRNHRNAVTTLEVLQGEAWVEVPRLDYNYFVQETGMGEGPLSLRITDVLGHTLEDSGIPLLDDADAPGAGQFPGCGE
ncbi:expansin EXLX1 family cellulose-binding protein [Paraliomyxa miuraensis]|uniref:expansin EXLX1 family cellulose-binding protein n=1 Tax=Paraliomyxa miuraensis TaxID=376150 RepID=UPI002251F733|nr:expansin EXLX1 family cellulose-binding protein [Paraliomyxa miuraensis]MCX4247136.1 expansin EXLX1 family cellulose-binding protein [Paraliomyxa miuraensis]